VTSSPNRIHPAAATGFELAADRYDRGRPTYPPEAFAVLVEALAIAPGSEVLELGAGTGKLTTLLLPTGANVTAVEPVAAMRTALVRNVPTVRALDGTAEAIPAGDASADAVVAAQAFHWFDAERALVEIHRVLRERGWLGMIWNVRDERPAWSRRLTGIFDRLSRDSDPRYNRSAWRPAFDRSDGFTALEHRSFRWDHQVTRETFLDRVLSVSYVASASEEIRRDVAREVRELLDVDPELAGREVVTMPYTTDVYWCRRR